MMWRRKNEIFQVKNMGENRLNPHKKNIAHNYIVRARVVGFVLFTKL